MDEPERRPGMTGRDLLVLAHDRVPKAYGKFARAVAKADPGLGAAFASMMMNPEIIPTVEDITPETFETLRVGDEILPPGTVGRRPDSLNAAWAEAEAALPEEWLITRLEWAPPHGWDAIAVPDGGFDHEGQDALGPTPAAALRALAAKLRDR